MQRVCGSRYDLAIARIVLSENLHVNCVPRLRVGTGAHVHNCDLACANWRVEGGTIAARTDLVDRTSQCTVLSDKERLQHSISILIYGAALCQDMSRIYVRLDPLENTVVSRV